MNLTTVDAASHEELDLLRASVQRLLERAGGLKRARADRGRPDAWDGAVMRDLADAGVLGVDASEEVGGLGMGLTAAGVIAEEIGRVLAPEPVTATVGLGVGLLQRLCPDNAILGKVMAGNVAVAVGWQERGPRGEYETGDCRHDGGKLTGAKAWMVGAGNADILLVVATGANGPVLAAVAPDADGVTLLARRQCDGSALHDATFAAARAEILAEGGAVSQALAAAVADTTALAAAELVGVSSAALEITLEFLRVREQFGQPIGRFQVLQHRAVDMHIDNEVARAAVRQALERIEGAADPGVRAREASRAKARACVAARKVTREAIQMHGAVGYTDEFDIGLFLNRAIVLSAWLGDASEHRRRWLEATEAREHNR
jgi:alkylation response protein AidB-like acyl-CoA dehydrogenase